MQLPNSTPNSLLFSTENILRLPIHYPMGSKGRAVPRVVCCAIPIARAAGKVLVVTSRKQPNNWLCKSPLSLHDNDIVSETTFFPIIQYLKVVGNRQMWSWRLRPRVKPWKKVLTSIPFSSPRFLTMVYPTPPVFFLFEQRAYEVQSHDMWSQYQRLQPRCISMKWMWLAWTTTGSKPTNDDENG